MYNHQIIDDLAKETKRSGATYSDIKNGQYRDLVIINAWNYSDDKGLIKAKVFPYNKTLDKNGNPLIHSNNQSGNKSQSYVSMMCEIFYLKTGAIILQPVLMNTETMVVTVPRLGMCITPNGEGYTKSGKKVTGYFGTFKK